MNKIASAKYLHIENYIQKIKFVSHKQHFFVFLPLEMQKRLKQTKVYHTFCYFAWKETTHKPLKVASAKNLFLQCLRFGTTCFDECFYSMW